MERYSRSNQLRIRATHPLATDCRPRSEWEKAGFRIVPGAQPAWILTPVAFDNGHPVGYKECPVYDIRQVEALKTEQEKTA